MTRSRQFAGSFIGVPVKQRIDYTIR